MTENISKFITDTKLVEQINLNGKVLRFKAGEVIIESGKYIKVVPFLLKGSIKISRVDSSGNEIFLYHIKAGQSCAVSLSTCLTDKISSIRAVAEETTEVMTISSDNAKKWFHEFQNWRLFVLNTMDARFDELLNTVDKIAFMNIEDRLLAFLYSKTKVLNTINLNITHQKIADELSTSREVISRNLKNLEKKNRVKLSRNKIELIATV